MNELLEQVQQGSHGVQIAMSALYEAVERLGDFREGYYSVRRCVELQSVLTTNPYRDWHASAEQALEEMVQNQKNVIASILEEIKRLERWS